VYTPGWKWKFGDWIVWLSVQRNGTISHGIKTHRRSTRVTADTPWFIIKMLTPWSQPVRVWETSPPGRPPFWILSGGECLSNAHWLGPWPSAFWLRITVTPKSLENHRKNQEVWLLCSLFCDDMLVLKYWRLTWPIHSRYFR
jgi:hypothetical protein